jgi:hypothetical protein
VNITLDIKCPELAEAINNLAAAMSIRAAGSELQDIVKSAAPEAEPEKSKTAAKPAAKKPTTPPTPEPETAGDDEGLKTDGAAPATSSSDDASASDIDYTQVKAAVLKVSQEKGRAAAVELLGEFDAKVGGDLTEEQWGPFLARAAEVLA